MDYRVPDSDWGQVCHWWVLWSRRLQVRQIQTSTHKLLFEVVFPRSRWLGVIIYWLFVFTVSVLLLSVLIAQFSHSYGELREKAHVAVTLTRARLLRRTDSVFPKYMVEVYYYIYIAQFKFAVMDHLWCLISLQNFKSIMTHFCKVVLNAILQFCWIAAGTSAIMLLFQIVPKIRWILTGKEACELAGIKMLVNRSKSKCTSW